MPLMKCLNVNRMWQAWRAVGCAAALVWLGFFAGPVLAQTSKPPVASTVPADASIEQWIERLHEASRRRSYVGTFVVSAGDEVWSSKIWHVCDGVQQMERIDTLTGTPRTTLRRNDEVLTLLPDLKTAVKEKREALGLFPEVMKPPAGALGQWYRVRTVGGDRVAGFDAQVVDFVPRDALRFGYRVWTEKKTGLVVKLQTRDARQQVLEQVAFTELQLDAPVRMDALAKLMNAVQGYQLVTAQLEKTTPEAQGWRLKQEVPGFQSMSCQVRADMSQNPAMQWVFSDGLASVSLFVEPFDAKRHTQERAVVQGATHSLTRRLGAHWVTAVGEVPAETLQRFVQGMEPTR
jgi:sigma-E factor negative regulatory protein RseB